MSRAPGRASGPVGVGSIRLLAGTLNERSYVKQQVLLSERQSVIA
jgi:hypothetical protein